MPISLNGATFDVVLDGDKGLDPEPTFICRYLAVGELLDLFEAFRAGHASDTYLGARELLEKALAGKVIGWRAMLRDGKEITFGSEPLSSLCSVTELLELTEKVCQDSQASEFERRRSRSAPTAPPGD